MKLYRLTISGFAALAAVVSNGALAQAGDAVRLAPAGPWALEYADDSCRLVRTFGTGDSAVTLGMTSYEPGGMFQLSVVGELTRPTATAATILVALGEVESLRVEFLQVDFGGLPGIQITNPISIGRGPARLFDDMRAFRPISNYSTPEAEAQATFLGFGNGMLQEFVAETGSLGGPIQALKDCTNELVTHWDIDHAAHPDRSRTPMYRRHPSSLIEMRRYPREMRQPTLINYRLIIDAEGEVAECHVVGLQPTDEFARITCDQLRASNFAPALDTAGNPVRSYFVSWHVLRR